MMAFPMIYTAIVTPLYIGLLDGSPRPIFVIDRVMDVIFISDMVRQRYVHTFALAGLCCHALCSSSRCREYALVRVRPVTVDIEHF